MNDTSLVMILLTRRCRGGVTQSRVGCTLKLAPAIKNTSPLLVSLSLQYYSLTSCHRVVTATPSASASSPRLHTGQPLSLPQQLFLYPPFVVLHGSPGMIWSIPWIMDIMPILPPLISTAAIWNTSVTGGGTIGGVSNTSRWNSAKASVQHRIPDRVLEGHQ